jgi:hypothetical protein
MSDMPVRPRRGWLIAAAFGCILVVIALVVVALVMIDKPHFGWLVGWMFLPIVTSGVLAGSLILFVSILFLPERKSWRGLTLLAWALIALTSPLLGLMFLLPFGVLAISLPLVIAIFMHLFRATAVLPAR